LAFPFPAVFIVVFVEEGVIALSFAVGSTTHEPHLSDAKSAHRLPLIPAGRFLPFLLVTALFFLWGIPNNLNDILIRQFMKSFEINRLQAGLVQSAFYLGYFLVAFPAGRLMNRTGYKTGILIGLSLYGAGCILFWPAALVARYWFFLMALFVIACGLAFLETASSPFIVQLGSSLNAEQRLNLSQSFNPLGSIAGTLVGARFIFSGVELTKTQAATMRTAGAYHAYLQSETLRVVAPYIVLGVVVLLWALLIAATRFPEVGNPTETNPYAGTLGPALWRRRHFVLAVAAQFLYVGAQVSIWSYLIPYVQNYVGLNERSAGYWLTGALVAFMLGRFASTVVLRYIDGARLLTIYTLLNAGICAVAALWPGWLGLGCLIAASFFMSMMFPTIFALGIKGLGLRTKTGGSLLVMAIIGGAVLTPIMGRICDAAGVRYGYLLPAVCFLGIALYAALFSKANPSEVLD
jgi:FHS family L-fucose permease-like MFS transporter